MQRKPKNCWPFIEMTSLLSFDQKEIFIKCFREEIDFNIKARSSQGVSLNQTSFEFV